MLSQKSELLNHNEKRKYCQKQEYDHFVVYGYRYE